MIFALWRTIPGVSTAFAFLAGAAAASHPSLSADIRRAVPLLAVLELFGWVTIAVAAKLGNGHVSRRLLGAWLASTGLLLLGGSLTGAPGTVRTGCILIACGLAYKVGIVPAFAWAPLLLRHTAARVEALGAIGFLAAFGALWFVLPRLDDAAAGRTVVAVLSLTTIPWSAWNLRHQWPVDRRCARSYAAVLGAASAALLHVAISAP
ncbi:MAG TPA: hypothetical protein VGI92_00380 [Gemmatimonadales bacterium]|jgi:hypothetical protein